MNIKKKFFNNFIDQIIANDLENNKYTNIRTRFPPEPNGYLHIGHAKSICLNFGIAESYKGQCNLRIDDTNPTRENIKYVEAIKQDICWLGFNWSGNIRYSSNYFDQLYEYAIELINKGLAYVDELSSKEIKEYRGDLTNPGKNSPYRDRSIKENIMLFKKMRTGNFEEGKACLRAKIDMSSPLIIMRDPVLYRIKFVEHHRTGNKWCIYPMYDFTHCISDAIEGITHSLCTMEFQNNRCLYDWILNNINISAHPKQYEFSRLNLEYTIMSKRKLNVLVTNKYVKGWDDPRMPTISGLRRRGYTASSIRKFCKRIGITRQDNVIKMSSLESCIRDDLNHHASRVMAIINPVKLIIENYPYNKTELIIVPNHPYKLEMGFHEVPFNRSVWIDRSDFKEYNDDKYYKRLLLGKEVRLRHSYIIKARYVKKDKYGNIIAIYCTYDVNTMHKSPIDGRKVDGVIHWVSVKYALPIEIRLYDHMFNIPNPESTDFKSVLNNKSLIIKYGYAEPSLKNAKIGKAYQFEREGYFCLDSHYNGIPVFNRTVSLRKSSSKINR